jgi:hypothetical protein
MQIGLVSLLEETRVSLKRKPSVLQGGAYSTFLPSENRVAFLNEYFLQIRFQGGESLIFFQIVLFS